MTRSKRREQSWSERKKPESDGKTTMKHLIGDRIHRESPGRGKVSQSDRARMYIPTSTEQIRYTNTTCQERILGSSCEKGPCIPPMA